MLTFDISMTQGKGSSIVLKKMSCHSCGRIISSFVPLTSAMTLKLGKVSTFFCSPTGSSFVVSEGSYLDISDWLNPAKLSLYYQINATSPWVRDLCGQRTTDACEQLCDPETGKSQSMGLEVKVAPLERESAFFPAK